jgi:hypothetical protein
MIDCVLCKLRAVVEEILLLLLLLLLLLNIVLPFRKQSATRVRLHFRRI